MGLTPEQETKCMLLNIRIFPHYDREVYTIWRTDKLDFLIDPRVENSSVLTKQLRYKTVDEAIEDYIKNKEHYIWV